MSDEPVSLEFLAHQLTRVLDEQRGMRAEMRSFHDDLRQMKGHFETIEDQVLVQGAILLRLENRMPLTQNNEPLAAMHQQLLRLERRLRALEESGG